MTERQRMDRAMDIQSSVEGFAEKQQKKRELPIGVFDSGVGGISVLREMVRLMPGEHFWFYGDSANAPYGTKSVEEIRALTLEKTGRMVRQGVKALVIACNTATSAAIRQVRSRYPAMPVIGIEPALKPAALMKEHPVVLVMATPSTVRGEKFHELAGRFTTRANIVPLPCPGLMEFVERGELGSPELAAHLTRLLAPAFQGREPDVIVLGCTHYPFLQRSIRQCAAALSGGREIPVLDGSLGTAREVKRRLAMEDLLRDSRAKGSVVFEMSIPEKTALCEQLLSFPDSQA